MKNTSNMKKIIYRAGLASLLFAALFISCKKSSNSITESAGTGLLTADEKNLVRSAGFNENWAEKTSDGDYLIEGDILLTKTQRPAQSLN